MNIYEYIININNYIINRYAINYFNIKSKRIFLKPMLRNAKTLISFELKKHNFKSSKNIFIFYSLLTYT
jgi:hypothetical protein